MKNIIVIIIKSMFVLFLFSCHTVNKNNITKEVFLADNSVVNFDKWKGWTISYRNEKDYYIAVFRDSVKNESESKSFIFWKNDSVIIRLTTENKMSSILSLNTARNDSIWTSFYSNINLEDLNYKINFMYNYKLDLVNSVETGIYFENSNFKLYKTEIKPSSSYVLLQDDWYIHY